MDGTTYRYEGPFDETLRIGIMQDEDAELPEFLAHLLALADAGRLVQTIYRPCPSPWERLCALEEDLSKAEALGGWSIVAGECVMLDGVTGWLEHDEGWSLVAVGPAWAAEHDVDLVVMPTRDFEEEFIPYAKARATLGDGSGLELNRALREIAAMEEAFAREVEHG